MPSLTEYLASQEDNAFSTKDTANTTQDGDIGEDEQPRYPPDDESEESFAAWCEANSQLTIPAGHRHDTLLHAGECALKKYGNTGKAFEIFMDYAKSCDPPLTGDRLDKNGIPLEWQAAVDYYKSTICQDPDYDPPLPLQPSDYSDVGQATVLAQEYVDRLRYSAELGWLFYDGVRWVQSQTMPRRLAAKLTDRQMMEADAEIQRIAKLVEEKSPGFDITAKHKPGEIPTELDHILTRLAWVQVYKSHVVKRRGSPYISNALQEAQAMLETDPQHLDANPYLLNCPNATYDLRYGDACPRKHDPEDFITQVTAVDPSDEGMDLWLDQLNLVFQKDDDLILFFQKCIGQALIGQVEIEEVQFWPGDGANGKSTVSNAIISSAGTYAGHISAEALTTNCRRNVRPELAELRGKRIVLGSELQEGMRLNTAIIKQLSSTDPIFAEQKYKTPFSFIPSHTLVICTNHLPRIGAMDDGIWRRICVIPFKAKITGKTDVKNYGQYLYENCGGAILKWCMKGAKMAIEENFKFEVPQAVRDAIGQYREANDWLQHFLDDCCDIGEANKEMSGEVYDKYRFYSARTGEWTRNKGDFYAALDAAGFRRKKMKDGSVVFGLQLKPNCYDFPDES